MILISGRKGVPVCPSCYVEEAAGQRKYFGSWEGARGWGQDFEVVWKLKVGFKF